MTARGGRDCWFVHFGTFLSDLSDSASPNLRVRKRKALADDATGTSVEAHWGLDASHVHMHTILRVSVKTESIGFHRSQSIHDALGNCSPSTKEKHREVAYADVYMPE